MSTKRFAMVMAAALWCLVLAAPARAIDFWFLYDDAPGTGFFDPVLGEQRRNALQAAGDIWGRLIRPAYEGEEIIVRAKFDTYPPDEQPLASAKPHFYYSDFGSSSPAYQSDTNYPKALANHLNLGDLAPVRHEIEITFNVAKPFYLGTDGMPGADEYDFVTVAAHELGHGLGFTASIRENGEFGYHGDGTYIPLVCPGCLPTPYDHFLTLGPNGTPLLSLSESQRENALVSNNVFWNGANATTGNGGTPVKIYAPSPYDEGSSISHVDSEEFEHALMNPGLFAYPNPPPAPEDVGVYVRHTPSAFERGMLRDMGWNISVASQQVSWTGAGGNNNASTVGNWSPALPLPGDDLAFGSAGAAGADVNMDLTLYSLGAIRFAENAPAYTLRFKPWTDTDLTGIGVERDLVGSQTIVLESRPGPNTAGTEVHQGNAAKMAFKNGAGAGNGTYELGGGGTGIHDNDPVEPHFNRTLGASLTFEGTATTPEEILHGTSKAETAHFILEGGAGNGAPGAQLTFKDDSTASGANIWNKGGRSGLSLPEGTTQAGFGGQTRFEDNARGGTADIRNDGTVDDRLGTGGWTTFADNASADHATVDNYGSTYQYGGAGGVTEFTNNANAGQGTFTNYPGPNSVVGSGSGRTVFFDQSTAGEGTFINEANTGSFLAPGETQFRGQSNAGRAMITNRGTTHSAGGTTRFFDNASAANATITHEAPYGRTEFNDNSVAGEATFVVVGDTCCGGTISFNDNSSAAQANFTVQPYVRSTAVRFDDQSTAGEASFVMQDDSNATILFYGHSNAGNAHFDIGRAGTLQFLHNSSAASAEITVRSNGTVAVLGSVTPQGPTATLGSAQVHMHGANTPASIAGYLWLNTGATADNATIIIDGSTVVGPAGGRLDLQGSAGNATIVINGGGTGAYGGQGNFWARGANNDTARLVVNAGGTAGFSAPSPGDITFGSIEGAGTINLASSQARLVTGSRNTDTIFAGQMHGIGGRVTKVGTGTLTLAGDNTYTGVTTIDQGTLAVTGSIAGSAVVNNGGTLKGNGTIGGTVTVNAGGVFAPGTSPGTITVGGLAMTPGSILDFELGTTRDHIVLTNNGNVALAGILNVSLLDGFSPTLGQSFALFEGAIGSLSGAFDSILLPTFNGHTFDVMQSAGSVMLSVIDAPPLPGDYNGNGIVDAADYTVWRDRLGSGTSLPNDDTPGVGQDDYTRWKTNFGATAGNGSGLAKVPEPTTALLAIVALLSIAATRRRGARASIAAAQIRG